MHFLNNGAPQAVRHSILSNEPPRPFPSTDPRWKDTAGVDFLRQVAGKVRVAGWSITSGHVLAVAEEPRLAGYLDAMGAAICEALGVPRDTIAVGATTTDGMGFAGRGEGIAASAAILLTSE